MPRFAANLSMMYTEWPFLERYSAAAEDGFEAAECMFPYEATPQAVAAALKGAGLRQVLFNAAPGRADAGERGIAALPGREAEFREAIELAVRYAHALECPRIHVMAGIVEDGARAAAHSTYVENLRWAARRLEPEGIEPLIEPINTRDIPGFFLNRQDVAHAICREVGERNLRVQFDLYHCQVVEGDVATKIRQYAGRYGHVQIAGAPARHEPDTGEQNYAYLFEVLDEVGYDGWVGAEYRPAAGTREGLGWWRRLRAR